MLGHEPYYPGIIKKSITAFGLLFSDIQIERVNSKGSITENKLINVPISYAPKEKWLSRIDQEPDLKNNTSISLPRMVFEITGYSYDATRKLNKLNKVYCYSANQLKSEFSPVPYNIDISLYLMTKTIEDGLSVMEQVLPIFTPDYSLVINAVPDLNIKNTIPIILNNITVEDNYESDFITTRAIIHTFTFTMKVNLFGNITTQGLVDRVNIKLVDQGEQFFVSATNPTTIQEEWTSDNTIPDFYNQ